MKKDISKHIIAQATRCNFDKQCLENDDYPLCKFKKQTDNGTIFVYKIDEHECPYVIGFGFSQVCGCPVRKEIYRKYKL